MRGDNIAISAHVRFGATPGSRKKKGRLTNACKVTIDRANHNDHRDATQTDHAESENPTHGNRYNNDHGYTDTGCDKTDGQTTYQASHI